MGDPQPRWLDPEEQETWLTLTHLILRLPATLDAQMQRDAGITHFDYLVLSVLDRAPERSMRMSELAEYTASSLSRLSNVVTRLEKRGWLRRAPDPAGRHTLAILTDKGQAEVQADAPGHVDEVRRLVFGPLTKAQQRQLLEIGRRILRAIDPDDRVRLPQYPRQPRDDQADRAGEDPAPATAMVHAAASIPETMTSDLVTAPHWPSRRDRRPLAPRIPNLFPYLYFSPLLAVPASVRPLAAG